MKIIVKYFYGKMVFLSITLAACGNIFAYDEHHHDHAAPEDKKSYENHSENNNKKHDMSAHDMEDNPLLTYVNIDQLEWRNNHSENTLAWDIESWTGYDANKLWLKAEGEKTAGDTEHSELQVLQSHAISSFWDIQTGLRVDTKPASTKNWFSLGFNGLAPYFVDIDTAVFFGEGGDVAWRLKMEKEIMLTQRIALVPLLELNAHGKNDQEQHTGSGLSKSEFDLRLRYSVERNISPYIGLHTYKTYGKTADYLRNENEQTDDAQLVIGVHVWY